MIIGIVNVQSGLSLDFKQGGDSLVKAPNKLNKT